MKIIFHRKDDDGCSPINNDGSNRSKLKKNNMKETTKAQFEAFKKTFLEYQKILNVQDYCVVFRHEDFDDPDTYADIFWSVECKHATVRFNKVLDENKYIDLDPESSGKHEALHLAFARAEYLCGSRFITSNEIDRTFEGLVRLFEEIV